MSSAIGCGRSEGCVLSICTYVYSRKTFRWFSRATMVNDGSEWDSLRNSEKFMIYIFKCVSLIIPACSIISKPNEDWQTQHQDGKRRKDNSPKITYLMQYLPSNLLPSPHCTFYCTPHILNAGWILKNLRGALPLP